MEKVICLQYKETMDLNQLLVIYIKVLMEMIYTIQLKKKHLISYI